MSIIKNVPLDRLIPFLGLNVGALGARVFLGGDTQVVGVRCVHIPAVGQTRPGFVPLEGSDKFMFLEDALVLGAPGLDVTDLTHIALEHPIVEAKSSVKPGDLCTFQGVKEMSVAIALPANPQAVAGYLVLHGQHVGHVVRDYQPEVCLGRIVVLLGQTRIP